MKLVAVANVKGGVGKTTTAVNLAHAAAAAGLPTLLWDLDPQAAATYLFRVRPKLAAGGRELLSARGVEAAIHETDYPGLDLLPSDFRLRELETRASGDPRRDGLDAARARLAERYEWVFVDCAPGLSPLAESVYGVADALLVPTIPTVLSLRTLARLMKHVKGLAPRPLVLPFFSLVDARKSLHQRVRAWAEEERLGFLASWVPYATLVEQMSLRRAPLAAFAPTSPASRAHRALWAELAARLAGTPGEAPTGRGLRGLLERAARRL